MHASKSIIEKNDQDSYRMVWEGSSHDSSFQEKEQRVPERVICWLHIRLPCEKRSCRCSRHLGTVKSGSGSPSPHRAPASDCGRSYQWGAVCATLFRKRLIGYGAGLQYFVPYPRVFWLGFTMSCTRTIVECRAPRIGVAGKSFSERSRVVRTKPTGDPGKRATAWFALCEPFKGIHRKW